MSTEKIFNVLWDGGTNAYRCGETDNLSTIQEMTAIAEKHEFPYAIADASPLACPLDERLEISQFNESTGTIP